MRVAPPALEDHYDEVIRAFSAGRLVPVLGPARGRRRRPRARDAARRALRARRGTGAASPTSRRRSPPRNGVGPLHDELHLALDRDSSRRRSTPGLPSCRRCSASAALPQQLIVSTASTWRRARVRRGRRGARRRRLRRRRPRPRQVPARPPRRPAIVVEEPNAYTGLALDERSVLLKIHGHVDRGATRERESFVVSEDDHIDYLVAATSAARCPSSSRRGCAAATCSSSATRSTTGACASSSAASGEATGSRTAPGRCSRGRRTSRSELWRERGAEVLRRLARRATPRSSRGSTAALARGRRVKPAARPRSRGSRYFGDSELDCASSSAASASRSSSPRI